MSQSIFITYSSLVGGLILGSAALSKIAKPRLIPVTVRRYQVLPNWLELPVAGSLVILEFFTAIALLSGLGKWIGLALAAALFLLFASLTAVMQLRGRSIPCGCLGASSSLRLGWVSVGLNLGLALNLALCAVVTELDSIGREFSSSGVLWTSAGAVAALYWLVLYALSVIGLVRERSAVAEPGT